MSPFPSIHIVVHDCYTWRWTFVTLLIHMEIWITDELLHETCNSQFISPTQRIAKIISAIDIGEQSKTVLKLCTKYYIYK